MSMKRVRELIAEWEADYAKFGTYDRASSPVALGLEYSIYQLKAAIAPDWHPASEPPEDEVEYYVLLKSKVVERGVYYRKFNVFQHRDGYTLRDVVAWHEIEVPEPPEVKP